MSYSLKWYVWFGWYETLDGLVTNEVLPESMIELVALSINPQDTLYELFQIPQYVSRNTETVSDAFHSGC